MTLYKHVLTVVVLSPECSSDTIERRLEEGFSSRVTSGESVSAVTLPMNRLYAPALTVPDPPKAFEDDPKYLKWGAAMDEWSDKLPVARNMAEAGGGSGS